MYKYTDDEIKILLKSMVVVVDSREQENKHILAYLNKKKIPYISQKLGHADYTCMIPKNEALGIMRDTYFNNIVSIERKGSVEELSGNLTQGRERFKDEMIRHKGRMYLLVEDGSYEKIATGDYKTGFDKVRFVKSLCSFQAKYNLDIRFVTKLFAGSMIYHTLYYHVRAWLEEN